MHGLVFLVDFKNEQPIDRFACGPRDICRHGVVRDSCGQHARDSVAAGRQPGGCGRVDSRGRACRVAGPSLPVPQPASERELLGGGRQGHAADGGDRLRGVL